MSNVLSTWIHLAFIVAVFVAGWLLLSVRIVWTYTHPQRVYSGKTPADYGLPFEAVRFRTADGLTLAGWWLQAAGAKGTILVAHGHPTEKGDVLDQAVFLVSAGYQVLLFDFRYYGESQGNFTSLGDRERLDILAALAYLKSRSDVDPRRIGALGLSFGAASLLVTPSDDLRAIVADSSFTSLEAMGRRNIRFGPFTRPMLASAFALAKVWPGFTPSAVRPVAAVRRPGPARLFIHGALDTQIPAGDSQALYAAAAEPKALWLVPGAEHVQALDVAPDQYRRRAVEFFDTHIAAR